MYPMHPDDMADIEATHGPRSWHNEFATYEYACIAYGVETPEQLRGEQEDYERAERANGFNTDDIETRHPTLETNWRIRVFNNTEWRGFENDCPFGEF